MISHNHYFDSWYTIDRNFNKLSKLNYSAQALSALINLFRHIHTPFLYLHTHVSFLSWSWLDFILVFEIYFFFTFFYRHCYKYLSLYSVAIISRGLSLHRSNSRYFFLSYLIVIIIIINYYFLQILWGLVEITIINDYFQH